MSYCKQAIKIRIVLRPKEKTAGYSIALHILSNYGTIEMIKLRSEQNKLTSQSRSYPFHIIYESREGSEK